MKLADFRENPDNPSKATPEELERLAGKLKRVPLGLTAMRIAYVTDDPAGGRMVISGNKRLRVLKKAYGDDADLPDEWFQDVTAMSPAERHEFIVTANVSDGSWDLDKLLTQYGRAELEDLMGCRSAAKLLENLAHKNSADCQDAKSSDDGTAAVENPESRLGVVYALGRHRLMCGDCTDKTAIDKLLAGQKADMVVTDPPYNVAAKGGTQDCLTIINDNMSRDDFQQFMDGFFGSVEYALKPGGVFYVWHGWGPEYDNALYKAKQLKKSADLVWVKNAASFCMNRLDYSMRHELCIYGWKTGAAHYFFGNNRTTVFEYDKPSRNALHPTMKPVELFADNINSSSRDGETVLDFFGGSGTTVIACENLGRRAMLMELDPKYCDVIRKRWAEATHGEGCDWKTLTPEAEV